MVRQVFMLRFSFLWNFRLFSKVFPRGIKLFLICDKRAERAGHFHISLDVLLQFADMAAIPCAGFQSDDRHASPSNQGFRVYAVLTTCARGGQPCCCSCLDGLRVALSRRQAGATRIMRPVRTTSQQSTGSPWLPCVLGL